MIRVGRYVTVDGKRIEPSYPGFEKVVVMMKSSKYASLSPYYLKDAEGHIIENTWQFGKVFERVPKSVQYYSQYDRTVIWSHPEETHVVDGELTPEYFAWREKGFRNPQAVRYPVGFHHRHNCLYSLASENGKINPTKLSYIEARFKIYMPLYINSVIKQSQFKTLLEKLRAGINLIIVEVDGPHEESMDYYKEKYGVADDFIQENTMLCAKENLNIMAYDPRHNFGHGYCLAMALMMHK